MKGVWIRVALFAVVAVVVFSGTASAGDAGSAGSLEISLVPLPCAAVSSAVEVQPLAEFELALLEELPLTPAEPEEKAVTCGSWIYNGCCISQTKYRRRCQFNAAEWWYEYKCQGVCVM